MANDRRLDKDFGLFRQQLLRIIAVSEWLLKHSSDIQRLAWDQSHPDANYPSFDDRADELARIAKGLPPRELPGLSQADKARRFRERMKDSHNGAGRAEAILNDLFSGGVKLFRGGPKADDTKRGILMGSEDARGQFIPDTPKREFEEALAAQRRREKRAPRTGETAHERLEPQPRAPKEVGEDPNLRKPA